MEVERGAVEKQVTLLVYHDLDAVLFFARVGRRIKRRIKPELVAKSTASTARNAHPKDRLGRKLLICNDFLDFAGRLFSKHDRHGV